MTSSDPGRPAMRRAPFTAMNRTINPVLQTLLRSPMHRPVSGRLALITYTGRRSGRQYTIPVLYRQQGNEVTIAVALPDRKVWWRNLQGEGARVLLHIRGQTRQGDATAARGADGTVTVRVGLWPD